MFKEIEAQPYTLIVSLPFGDFVPARQVRLQDFLQSQSEVETVIKDLQRAGLSVQAPDGGLCDSALATLLYPIEGVSTDNMHIMYAEDRDPVVAYTDRDDVTCVTKPSDDDDEIEFYRFNGDSSFVLPLFEGHQSN